MQHNPMAVLQVRCTFIADSLQEVWHVQCNPFCVVITQVALSAAQVSLERLT
jgi:hypothetical protein